MINIDVWLISTSLGWMRTSFSSSPSRSVSCAAWSRVPLLTCTTMATRSANRKAYIAESNNIGFAVCITGILAPEGKKKTSADARLSRIFT